LGRKEFELCGSGSVVEGKRSISANLPNVVLQVIADGVPQANLGGIQLLVGELFGQSQNSLVAVGETNPAKDSRWHWVQRFLSV